MNMKFLCYFTFKNLEMIRQFVFLCLLLTNIVAEDNNTTGVNFPDIPKPSKATTPFRKLKNAQNGASLQPIQTTSVNQVTEESPENSTLASSTTTPIPVLTIPPWSYVEMDQWPGISAVCGNGLKQSPIHLSLENSITATNFVADPIEFINYDAVGIVGNLTNEGHNLIWVVDQDQPLKILPKISGSGYGQRQFVLDHLVFRWGGNDVENYCRGSDHVVEYEPAPMEVQFVHRNTRYGSYFQAQTRPDGVAVLSKFQTTVLAQVKLAEFLFKVFSLKLSNKQLKATNQIYSSTLEIHLMKLKSPMLPIVCLWICLKYCQVLLSIVEAFSIAMKVLKQPRHALKLSLGQCSRIELKSVNNF